MTKQNPMREIKIEKVVLSIGGTGDELEKGVKLLEMLSKRKPAKMMSGGGAMTMAQLRSAAKQRGMSLSPMKKAKGGAAKKK